MWATHVGDDAAARSSRPSYPAAHRLVLTVIVCFLVIILPFGPYRLWLAAMVAVVQASWSVLVHRRRLGVIEELANYVLVEHLIMLVIALVAPSAYPAVALVAVGSLGYNSPYLPTRWHRALGVITTVTLIAPVLIHDVAGGLLVLGPAMLIVGQVVFNRSGVLILAEEVAVSARYQAEHDSLTGLANRRVLQSSLADLDGGVAPAALVVLDINQFKGINDTLGHDIGDSVLCEVAKRLSKIDDEVLVVRLGGDEFAVLVPGDAERAQSFAARADFCLGPSIELSEISLCVTASIGVAHAPDVPALSLLRCADLAMYRSKRDGSGPTWYRPEDDQDGARRIALMQDLSGAIELGHVRPWFQPQVDILTGEVVGAEALARWHHPRFGVIGADELLDHVSSTGRRREFVTAMLDQSLHAAVAWPGTIRLAVNVSLRDIQDDHFVQQLDSIIEATGFDPCRLTLEVVEGDSDVMPERIIEASRQIRSSGVSLSLDDFGQASSSLARLAFLEADEVKIDRRFIKLMSDSRRDAAVVDAVVALAGRLGLRLVAEGVETEAMARAVTEAGIAVAQGYHYARPSPTLGIEGFDPPRWSQLLAEPGL